jgi:hypothetical protein
MASMEPPDDPQTIRRLLNTCAEAIHLTRDIETVKRVEEYASELRQRLRELTKREEDRS